MNYLITGGTGLIGQQLCDFVQSKGHTVFVLSRHAKKVQKNCGASVIPITSLEQIGLNEVIDVVINLAGAPIADRRWTRKRKRTLEQSRIGLTSILVEWMQHQAQPPKVLISASAVGWYGDQGEIVLDENSAPHEEFTHQLCHQWEHTALLAQAANVRVCIIRIGPVLAKNGGFLKRLLPAFRLGLGGPIGSGQQYLSWIHIDDLIRLICHLADLPTAKGIFNGTAPNPITNQTFTEQLAAQLHRPNVCRAPAGLLKCLLGEMSILLTGGQRVIPTRTQETGFKFNYPELTTALTHILSKH
jgi:hypothetical protein